MFTGSDPGWPAPCSGPQAYGRSSSFLPPSPQLLMGPRGGGPHLIPSTPWLGPSWPTYPGSHFSESGLVQTIAQVCHLLQEPP